MRNLAQIAPVLFASVTIAACGSSDSPATTTEQKASSEPAATGARESSSTVLTVERVNGKLSPATLKAQPGVVTLRFKNAGQNPARLAIKNGTSVLSESSPAAGKQIGTLTIPVESGKSYSYYVIGDEEHAGDLAVTQ